MSDENNPMRRAQAAMRVPLPKRFYKEVTIGEVAAGFAILLDGKTAKTPGTNALALPNFPLAAKVAEEWSKQGERLEPMTMPLTRLAHVAIDSVAAKPHPVIDEIVKYAGSDLLFYRAGEPEGLVAAQSEKWNPVLDWAENFLDVRFKLAEGIVHVAQDGDALAAVRAVADMLPRPFALAAAASATNLGGSALIALALAHGELDAQAAWRAAHVDEDWNIRQWGEDVEVAERRAVRRAEFEAAAAMLALTRPE